MSDIAEVLTVVFGVMMVLFIIAWFTLLPMIGLLYTFGWLR